VVTPIYPWPGLPSEGSFVHRQVRQLCGLGIDCRVIMFRPAPRGLPRLLQRLAWLRHGLRWLRWPRMLDGVRVDYVFYHSPLRRGSDLVPRAATAIGEHLRAHPELADVDVMYAHWLWPGGAVALALRERLPALQQVPVVAIARGSDVHGWLDAHPHCRGHAEHVLQSADLVLSNCRALEKRADALLPAKHLRVVPVVYNGVDTGYFRPSADPVSARRRLDLPSAGRLLLCCASVKRRKGMYELADAWERVAPDLPEWNLVVIGSWVEPAAVARLCAAGARTGGRVIVRGAVPPDEARDYMSACDGLVHPSHAEGVANATMEAMASALPVISTDVDGQVEIIEDGISGWLIPPHDVGALAEAILRLARNPADARRLGAAARQRMERRFESEHHARRLAGLLAGIARGSSAGADEQLSVAS
jgi:glycosyltransferase involved in cell wall biosynthesis